jgi:hypothetical protein
MLKVLINLNHGDFRTHDLRLFRWRRRWPLGTPGPRWTTFIVLAHITSNYRFHSTDTEKCFSKVFLRSGSVARWSICIPRIPIWIYFGMENVDGIFYVNLVYLMFIGYILCPLVYFTLCHLVYFMSIWYFLHNVIWYILCPFGIFCGEFVDFSRFGML